MRPDTHDYRELFLNDVPLMDARAPVEFSKGAFPGALNLPLMNDQERHQVGICYKQHGQQAAIALGNKLVSGSIKAADRKSTRLNSSHVKISYAVFCLTKKNEPVSG